MKKHLWIAAALLPLAWPMAAISAEAPGKTIIIPDKRDYEYDTYHYAPAIRAGDMVIVSGIPAGGPGTYKEQIRRMFRRVAVTLEAAGASMDDVVELTTFHATAKNTEDFRKEFEEFSAVHSEFFTANYPAWTAVGNTTLLSNGAVVEMRVVAMIGSGKNARVVRLTKGEGDVKK